MEPPARTASTCIFGSRFPAAPSASKLAPSGRITVWRTSQTGVMNGAVSAMNSTAYIASAAIRTTG
jgi:hypothetical protein